ncbi:hypothetical protein MSAS_43420 [Mycobacterium saskatchewanense]|nr:hypothetical protein MSAS_43420 [Mycobacterium saskatchewanense]
MVPIMIQVLLTTVGRSTADWAVDPSRQVAGAGDLTGLVALLAGFFGKLAIAMAFCLVL